MKHGLIHGKWASLSLIVFIATSGVILQAFPKIKIEGERSADFGRYPANQTKNRVFDVVNVGDDPLTIFKVRRTCGCLKLSGLKKTIEPGEKVGLHVEIPAYSIFGRYEKKLFLECDDPREKHVIFSLKGEAVPLLDIAPDREVHVGRLPVGATWEKTFSIRPNLKGVEIEPPELDSNYPGKTTFQLGDDAAELRVEINIDEVKGDLKCKVLVPIRLPEGWDPAEIVVSGKVGLCLSPTPSELIFREVSGKSARKVFHIFILGGPEDVALDPNLIRIGDLDGVEFRFKKGKRSNGCLVEAVFSPAFFDLLREKKLMTVEMSYPGAESAKMKFAISDGGKTSDNQRRALPLHLKPKPKPKPKPDIRRWRRR